MGNQKTRCFSIFPVHLTFSMRLAIVARGTARQTLKIPTYLQQTTAQCQAYNTNNNNNSQKTQHEMHTEPQREREPNRLADSPCLTSPCHHGWRCRQLTERTGWHAHSTPTVTLQLPRGCRAASLNVKINIINICYGQVQEKPNKLDIKFSMRI